MEFLGREEWEKTVDDCLGDLTQQDGRAVLSVNDAHAVSYGKRRAARLTRAIAACASPCAIHAMLSLCSLQCAAGIGSLSSICRNPCPIMSAVSKRIQRGKMQTER